MNFHTYDDECRLTIENIQSKIDVYSFSHLFSWLFLSFMTKDCFFNWIWAFSHEILEYSG